MAIIYGPLFFFLGKFIKFVGLKNKRYVLNIRTNWEATGIVLDMAAESLWSFSNVKINTGEKNR